MPKADFEAAIETAKAVAGQVSTAFMLKQAAASRPRPALTDEVPIAEVVPVIPQSRPQSALSCATDVMNAIQQLANPPHPARGLRDAIPFYQHHHVTGCLEAAMATLTESKEAWAQPNRSAA